MVVWGHGIASPDCRVGRGGGGGGRQGAAVDNASLWRIVLCSLLCATSVPSEFTFALVWGKFALAIVVAAFDSREFRASLLLPNTNIVSVF